MSWLLGVVVFLVVVAAMASAVHALFTVRTAQGTIGWVIGLIAFPWLALPLYWMFGCQRFRAYAEAMQRARTLHEESLQEVRRTMAQFETRPPETGRRGIGTLAAIADQNYMAGDRIHLLIDGEATFDAILTAIREAKHSIYLQFYIMREDELGLRLLEALAARAAGGVEVCFLIDSLGSFSMRPAVRKKWRDRGIRMKTFCALSKWRDRWRLNFRNHRKIVVVDGEIGFLGGHNVGDEYLGRDPKFGRWRDTHARVEGPTVLQLQMVFIADWFFATGEKLAGPWTARPQPGAPDSHSLILASGPADEYERCTHFFLNVISMARTRLWIASPYFVPDEVMLQALQLAAIRGVEVRILVPEKPTELLVWLASLALLTELAHPKIRIYRYAAGFLHQKVLVVDDDLAALGSANFDNRSFRLNFEVTLAVVGRDFAAEVSAMLERDFEDSFMVGPDDYAALSLPVKVGARIARLLAPIL